MLLRRLTTALVEKLLTLKAKGWFVTELGSWFVFRGKKYHGMVDPQTATATATLTAAQMLGDIIVATPAAAAAYTTLTGTLLKAALPAGFKPNDSFDLTIINIGGTGDDITLTGGTDVTIVGEAVLRPGADAATEHGGQGTWRFRNTTGVTFVAYRIS